MVKNSTPVPADGSSASGAAAQNFDTSKSLENLKGAALRGWIENESRAMDSTNNNTDEAQIKIRAQAQTLTAPQLQELTQIALNLSLPANARIFAAYLLNLSGLPESTAAMFDLARSPMPDLGPVLPHTEAEVKHGQELALRYMQVDELFLRAKTDANALDKLNLLAREADSERVRAYAEKKLRELK